MKILKKIRIFVTGAGGMLGEAVYQTLNNIATLNCTDIDANESFLHNGDVREYEVIRKQIIEFKPNIIFHLAALTDLEQCEKDATNAWRTNALGTENIVRVAKELDLPLVYISTAGIFDGDEEFYTDYDFPNPINIYGKSKYAGELIVARLNKHYVFRAGWMMGGGPKKDKKFVGKVMKQIRSGKKDLYVVDDKLGTPTYTFDFVKNIILVLENDAYGIYNLVCDDSGSRYDVAQEMLKLLGRKDIRLHKVSSDHFKEEYFAKRPRSEKLTPFKLKERNLYVMRSWRDCLKEYLVRWQ